MEPDAHLKQCARCRLFKVRDLFNKDAQAKDGLHSYCRKCLKEKHDELKAHPRG
jgi:hypothetical protein